MVFKITVLGEGGVGKTALTVQVSTALLISWETRCNARIYTDHHCTTVYRASVSSTSVVATHLHGGISPDRPWQCC
jgi:hypothetical protein